MHTAIIDGRSRRRHPLRRPGRRARQPLPAPGRPAGRGLDRERAGCAARGTATTTTRRPARPPAGFTDAPVAFAVEERDDGTYVELPDVVAASAHRVRRARGDARRPGASTPCSAWSGHSNLGFAEALRKAEERGELRYIGIRHEGAAAFAASAYGKLTGRPAACFAIAGPGLDEPAHRPLRRASSTARRCSRSPVRCRRRCSAGARSRTSTCPRCSATSPLSTVTVHAGSDHAELAATAVKHALDGRGVAHLVLPDEVQDLPSDAPAGTPATAGAPTWPSSPSPATPGRRARAAAGRPPPVIIVGQGARGAARRAAGAGRAARRPGAHHVPGQGPAARHPSARRRRARSLRHPGRVLADERVRPAAGRRGLVRQPHRDRAVQADRADRRRPDRDRPLPPGRRRGARRRRGGAADAARLARRDAGRRPARRRRRPVGDLARGEGPPRRRRPGPRRLQRRRVRGARPRTARPRRRSRSTSATTPTPSAATSRAPGSRCSCRATSARSGSATRRRWAPGPPTRPRPVVAVTGDGGFGQYLAELTTAVKYRIPVKHVLLDNGVLGKISKEQLAGAYAGLADLAGQPRLRRVRQALRRHRHPGAARRRARRGHEGAVRRRRARPCCTSTPTPSWCEVSTGLVIVLAVAAGVPLLLGLLPALRLPGALLEIVVGVLIGPSVLGWVTPDATVEGDRPARPVVPAVPGRLRGRPAHVRRDPRPAGRGVDGHLAGRRGRRRRACCSRSGSAARR